MSSNVTITSTGMGISTRVMAEGVEITGISKVELEPLEVDNLVIATITVVMPKVVIENTGE